MTAYGKTENLFTRDEATHKLNVGDFRRPDFDQIKKWLVTEKIDGTNIRLIWEPAIDGGADAPGRPERLRFGGKTDNAQIHADLVTWLIENITTEKLRSVFPTTDAVIYGEGYGAGIQKGGHYSKTKQFIVFDVLVDGKWWLNWENTCDVAAKFGLKTVPFIGEMSLEAGVAMVRSGFDSVLAKEQTGEVVKAEGLVGRPVEALFDKKGQRLIIKIKTRDF